jgi:glutamate-ammonia-ligase adenylyltransferase
MSDEGLARPGAGTNERAGAPDERHARPGAGTSERVERGGRAGSTGGRLARLGFADPDRAARLLADPALAGLVDPLEDLFQDGLVTALGAVPDPDLALLALVRLLENVRADGRPARLRAVLRAGGPVRDRLLAVLGTSAALGDHLARHPAAWRALDHGGPEGPGEVPDAARAALLVAVGADPRADEPVAGLPVPAALDALRVAYRYRLLAVAGVDLAAADPAAAEPNVSRALADLAGAALEAALAIARAELPAGAEPCRLAVIGMGKCGGQELNYVSDVDVVYVAEPLHPDGDEQAALATAAKLAAGLARACSDATDEGTLWPVDAALRPEGKRGPLVRTLESHVAYYRRWAQTWEFQALLKARPVAGDVRLGEAYLDAIRPMVWRAAEREHFVEDVQAMRRRVEETVPARQAGRQLKLGPGGLRDVEFSVQLLQLVHGRVDPRLRTGNTLEALEALATYGYVGRDDAAELDRAYRVLRAMEHRIQLYRLRRTHVVPADPADLRRLGRSLGLGRDPAAELEDVWRRHAREVRRLHEKLFYRPLLAAAARLTTDEVRLTPEAARARLAALGYRDPAGALRHLAALTAGVSRRAAIQRQLLPVLLGWFADGPDPDAGLLAFRRLSEDLGTTHWYLKMLRDSGAAAERMAHVLSSSRYVAQLLERGPEAVALLGDDGAAPRRPGCRRAGRPRRAPARARPDRHRRRGWPAPARRRRRRPHRRRDRRARGRPARRPAGGRAQARYAAADPDAARRDGPPRRPRAGVRQRRGRAVRARPRARGRRARGAGGSDVGRR